MWNIRASRPGDAAEKPDLIRFLAYHASFGALVGCMASGAMIAFDAGGLRTLLVEANSILAGSFLLVASFALTFGSLAMGSAVMLLPRK